MSRELGAMSKGSPTLRWALGWVLVLFWLGTLGWHARRIHFRPEPIRLAEAAVASLGPEAHFYALLLEGQAIGLASSRLDTLPDGFQLEDRLTLELSALGQTGLASAFTRVTLTQDLRVRSFDFSLDSGGGRFAVEGTMVGDTTMAFDWTAGGAPPRSQSVRLSEPPVFGALVPIRVVLSRDVGVGTRLQLPVFDPSTLSSRTVDVEVLGRDTLIVADSAALDPASGRWVEAGWDTIPVWHLAERFGGVQMESWVDDRGRVVRAASALGFTMERTAFELAQQAREGERARAARGEGRTPDLILSTAVASNVDLGTRTEYPELRFLLRGVELSGFELDGGRQTLRGDTLIVRRETLAGLTPGYTLPYPRMDLREALVAEPLVESDDPRIVAAARSAAGSGWRPDPTETALRLNAWVHRRLRKEVAFSVPSAVAVLEAGAGDCNEHTVLYVAMARALGLPARTAVGLVYLDGAFFYHAWPEVWLGEWVAMDPTFGETPASAAHLRFKIGGLAQQVEILRLIGNVRVTVLEAGG